VDDQYRSIGIYRRPGGAAVLLLLFGLENRILVIDQPEDYVEDPSSGENVSGLERTEGLRNKTTAGRSSLQQMTRLSP